MEGGEEIGVGIFGVPDGRYQGTAAVGQYSTSCSRELRLPTSGFTADDRHGKDE